MKQNSKNKCLTVKSKQKETMELVHNNAQLLSTSLSRVTYFHATEYYTFFTLRWLTTVFLRHNCARWEILSDAIFFCACNTWRHHREKAENTSEIWLVEIARGVLLTFFIMNGRSLGEVGERYRYKISVNPRQKPWEVVVKILMFIARAILRYFSARLSCTHAQFCSPRRSQKKTQIDFFTPIYSKTDRITHSKKFRINS